VNIVDEISVCLGHGNLFLSPKKKSFK